MMAGECGVERHRWRPGSAPTALLLRAADKLLSLPQLGGAGRAVLALVHSTGVAHLRRRGVKGVRGGSG